MYYIFLTDSNIYYHFQHRIDKYFRQIKEIIQARVTSSRVRFMMQDVVDLRHENWVSRKEDNSPKTIDELHKETADKAKKARLKIQLEKKIQRGIYCTFSNFISCHNGDLGDLPL